MMNVALQDKNVYEDFEPRTDTLYFKVGSHDLVSFHGKNYNIKRRLSPVERNRLLSDAAFVHLESNCYVNACKITHMEEDSICFGESTKRIPCSKRKQQIIRDILASTGH
jgi:hypothetical protein